MGQLTFWLGCSFWGWFSGSPWFIFLGSFNISGLIVFYSIDAMEQRMLAVPSRRAAFLAYQKSTSKLLLWPRL